jgi:hypothetical protein
MTFHCEVHFLLSTLLLSLFAVLDRCTQACTCFTHLTAECYLLRYCCTPECGTMHTMLRFLVSKLRL